MLRVLRALHIRGVRGLGRLIMVSARHLQPLQEVPVPMDDGRVLYLDLRDPCCVAYLLTGEIPYEAGETRFVRSVVRPGDTVIDAGAFVGWYSTLLAELVGSHGRVYAFEPNERVYDLLLHSAQKYPALKVIRAALGDQTGEARLYVPIQSNKASLVPPSLSRKVGGCDMVALDEFLDDEGRPRVAFVKCDVEGAEQKVLEGASRLLNSSRPPSWMMEMSPEIARRFGHDVKILADRFCTAGYSAFKIDSETGFLEPLADLPDCMFNAAFVPVWLRERVEPLIRGRRSS